MSDQKEWGPALAIVVGLTALAYVSLAILVTVCEGNPIDLRGSAVGIGLGLCSLAFGLSILSSRCEVLPEGPDSGTRWRLLAYAGLLFGVGIVLGLLQQVAFTGLDEVYAVDLWTGGHVAVCAGLTLYGLVVLRGWGRVWVVTLAIIVFTANEVVEFAFFRAGMFYDYAAEVNPWNRLVDMVANGLGIAMAIWVYLVNQGSLCAVASERREGDWLRIHDLAEAFAGEVVEHDIPGLLAQTTPGSAEAEDHARSLAIDQGLQALVARYSEAPNSLTAAECNLIGEAADVWEAEARKYIPDLYELGVERKRVEGWRSLGYCDPDALF